MVPLKRKEGRSLHYMDGKCVVFAEVSPGQDMDFPVITGELELLGLEEDTIRDDSPAGKALAFLRLAAQGNANLAIQDISEIQVSARQGLVVYLVEHPFPIYLGHEDIKIRYDRLVIMLERLYRNKKVDEITAIRMDYGEDKALVAGIEQEHIK
jgi:hypothetical protein